MGNVTISIWTLLIAAFVIASGFACLGALAAAFCKGWAAKSRQIKQEEDR